MMYIDIVMIVTTFISVGSIFMISGEISVVEFGLSFSR